MINFDYSKWVLNGMALSYFGLVPTDDMAEVLVKPAELKSMTYDDNEGIDGSLAITVGRKYKRNEISLKFYMVLPENTMSFSNPIKTLEQSLIGGNDNDGVNVLITDLYTFRLVYLKISKIQLLTRDKCYITINFAELNPSNRSVPEKKKWYVTSSLTIRVFDTYANKLTKGVLVYQPDSTLFKQDGYYTMWSGTSVVTKQVKDGKIEM